MFSANLALVKSENRQAVLIDFGNFLNGFAKSQGLIVLNIALKLTDLWITILLFDLNYKFINGSFAFSPG